MTVVFDANVGASASFWRGAPFDCLAAWAQGRCEAVVSAALLAEYHETIEELRLDYPHRKCAEWVEALTESAKLVFPVERASGATFDPDDEMVLECALAAGLSRVGQRRAGFAAAQFPPAPPAPEPPPHANDPALGQSRQKPAVIGACQAHPRLARCAQDECEQEPILPHPRSAKHTRARQKPNSYQ